MSHLYGRLRGDKSQLEVTRSGKSFMVTRLESHKEILELSLYEEGEWRLWKLSKDEKQKECITHGKIDV